MKYRDSDHQCGKQLKRRSVLAGGLALFALAMGVGTGAAHAATRGEKSLKGGRGKILVAYYSWSGNTRQAAGMIRERIGGHLMELQPVTPYSTVYNEVTAQAKEELGRGYLPPLQALETDPAGYDTVFLGSPNWWGTLAPPVMSFLSEQGMAGKTIIPFITHEGSRLGRSVDDIRRLASGAAIMEGLAVRGRGVGSAGDDVSSWLRRLGFTPLA